MASHHPRQLLISGMIALWAGRLGYYLFGVSPSFLRDGDRWPGGTDADDQRVLKHGKDSRFDEIKKNPGQFSVAWYVNFSSDWME
jgi:hypothetical protein